MEGYLDLSNANRKTHPLICCHLFTRDRGNRDKGSQLGPKYTPSTLMSASQLLLPKSFSTLNVYWPLSCFMTDWILKLATLFSKLIEKYLLGTICFPSFSHFTLSSGVPATTHSRVTGSFSVTSTDLAFSRIWAGSAVRIEVQINCIANSTRNKGCLCNCSPPTKSSRQQLTDLVLKGTRNTSQHPTRSWLDTCISRCVRCPQLWSEAWPRCSQMKYEHYHLRQECDHPWARL